MLVYHFINTHYGIEAIANRRLKVSGIMEFNDPFEFIGVNSKGRKFRKAIKESKKELSKSKGILCFSKAWSNPILWSHYADKHKGLCLAFEVPDELLAEVDYVSSRLPAPQKIDEAFMKQLLFTKFEHWAYEQEYRMYIELTEEENGIFFAGFSEQLQLAKVIVGDNSNVTRTQLSEALGDQNSQVEPFKARAGFGEFEVVRQANIAKWG
jgi:hypothetical protein